MPPRELRQELAAAAASLRIDALRAVPEQNLHVTVAFLGDVDEAEIEALTAALLGVAGRHPAFPLRLAGTRPAPSRRPRMLWAVTEPSESLRLLARDVDEAAAPFAPGRGRPAGEQGHITLARFKGPNPGLSAGPVAVSDPEFAVAELCLMRSRLSPAGAEYEVVAVLALAGGPQGEASA